MGIGFFFYFSKRKQRLKQWKRVDDRKEGSREKRKEGRIEETKKGGREKKKSQSWERFYK